MYDCRQDLQRILTAFGGQEQELQAIPDAMRSIANLVQETNHQQTAATGAEERDTDVGATTTAPPVKEQAEPAPQEEPPVPGDEAVKEPTEPVSAKAVEPQPAQVTKPADDSTKPAKPTPEPAQPNQRSLTTVQYEALQKIKNAILEADSCLGQLTSVPALPVDFSRPEEQLNLAQDSLSVADQQVLSSELGLAKSHLKRLKKVAFRLQGRLAGRVAEESQPTGSEAQSPEASAGVSYDPASIAASPAPAPASEEDFASLLAQSEQAEQAAAWPQVDLPADHYLFRRQRSGGMLVDGFLAPVAHLGESRVRKLGLTNGDEVLADKNATNVHQIVGHTDHLQDNRVGKFTMAKVEEDASGQLIVRENANGQHLTIDGTERTWPVQAPPGKYYHLSPGDLVDLAWYDNGDPVTDEQIMIRWTYATHRPDDCRTQSAKQLDAAKEPEKKAGERVEATPHRRYALDLHGKTVAILVGKSQNHVLFEQAVKRYNGKPRVIDAFTTAKKKLANRFFDVDLIVMVAAYSKHTTFWSTTEIAKKHEIPFAISSSFSVMSFERALYRAANGMPINEPSGMDQSLYVLAKDAPTDEEE